MCGFFIKRSIGQTVYVFLLKKNKNFYKNEME